MKLNFYNHTKLQIILVLASSLTGKCNIFLYNCIWIGSLQMFYVAPNIMIVSCPSLKKPDSATRWH